MGMSDIVKAMTFPTKMRWGSYDFEFVRPIHWMVSLLGSEVVPVKSKTSVTPDKFKLAQP